ncbi:MAG: hypothetical protein A2152_02605 [Candidatus Levybacteria bacterium RBG_16_35_6]|nr:MAG: hypothetical protein A2152_02605 [Candidatus Levybacteria bacterium RBG_16_35_6]
MTYFSSIKIYNNNEILPIEMASLKRYQEYSSKKDLLILQELAKEFKGKRIIFINSTPQGGGVALMRQALIRLYKLIDVDAHWYVLRPKPNVFNITKKKFHNVLQSVCPADTILNDSEIKIYNEWIYKNAKSLRRVFEEANVVVIDDPQPSGLIPYIKKFNPKAKIIYRSHIQIESFLANKKGTSQNRTWNFIWNNIKLADCFVFHPIKEFVPENVPQEKVVFMPATTDPLDGLNRKMNHEEITYYLKIFNEIVVNQERQTPLNLNRSHIIQIARFDPSKGIPDVIESYRKLRERLNGFLQIPQLVICGNSSIDDPEGKLIYDETIKLLKKREYRILRDDIKIVRLPHIDDVLNALLRKSEVALQLSTKEGFEVKVTEALMKGKPVIAYRSGGIPLQIRNRVNGFLVEKGNTDEVADHLYNLLTDKSLYKKMSDAAIEYAQKDFLTVPNAISWLYLSNKLLSDGKIEGNYLSVKEMAEKEYINNTKVWKKPKYLFSFLGLLKR